MPQACIVQNVQGLLLCESNGTVGVCAGEVPQKSADRKTHGFTISRVAGISSNGLDVNIHQWHDGLSAVRTKAVYDIIQPAGVNCVVPNVLSATP